MKTIIIVDTETTGLDPKTDHIVELGAVVYSIEHRCVVEQFAVLADAGAGNAAEAINRIPAAALLEAPAIPDVVRRLEHLVTTYDVGCLVAHRSDFDRSFLEADGFDARGVPWVCSKFDIAWPHSRVGASCVEMALAHGVPVVSAHRALTDCMLIAKTCEAVQREGHDLAAMIARALRPKATFVAQTPKPWDMSDEEWAALKRKLLDSGFTYDGGTRRWLRTMAVEDAPALPFDVREVA